MTGRFVVVLNRQYLRDLPKSVHRLILIRNFLRNADRSLSLFKARKLNRDRGEQAEFRLAVPRLLFVLRAEDRVRFFEGFHRFRLFVTPPKFACKAKQTRRYLRFVDDRIERTVGKLQAARTQKSKRRAA